METINKMKKLLLILLGVLLFNLVSVTPVSALSVAVHVPEKYTDVHAGERFYFEIEVKYPENPKRKDLRLGYEIKKDDEIIAHSKVLKAIETQASFMDFIVIPESAKTGLHVINVKVADYDNLSEEVSASFQVVGANQDQLKMYFLILLSVISFVGVLVVINIISDRKNRA